MDSEQYEELQNLLTKSREDEKNIKNELNSLQQTLADEKQKSEESLALVKQKEEDIKVSFTKKTLKPTKNFRQWRRDIVLIWKKLVPLLKHWIQSIIITQKLLL